MIGTLLVRGLVAGLFAGLLAFGFAKVFGEPSVDAAIAIEEAGSAAAGDAAAVHQHGAEAASEHSHAAADAAEEEELVSRPTQAGIGLLTGTAIYGTAIGGIFALVFGFAYGRIEGAGARTLAAALALIGFVVVILVPQIKYPANPPAVGHGETIGYRTAMFMTMLLVSILAAAAGTLVRDRLRARLGAWNATLAGVAAFVVVVAIGMGILPAINEVPDTFPAALLWQFRLASLGTQVVLWTTLGLAFGVAADRLLRPAR
jgi:hypothetical protein